MAARALYVDNAWDWASDDEKKPIQQRFFEFYARTIDARTFGQQSITKWYSSKVEFRSETGKVFRGAEEMREWLAGLFFSFERVRHIPEYYTQYNDGEATKGHAGFRRQLWIKGNTGADPDIDVPVGWVCEIGPADDPDGHFGVQFKKVSIYWDKTKTIELLKRALPSDA